MTSWIRLTLAFSVIPLLACVPTPDEVASTSDAASSSSTSAGPGDTTTPGTTMPGEDTVGTQGITGTDTTMGADTTAGVSVTEGTTTVDPSTSSSSGGSSSGGESSSTGEPGCVVPADCPNNETCNGMGECESVCLGGWGMGSYAYCLSSLGTVDTNNLCGPGHTCGLGGDPVEAATCVPQGCSTVCDCPDPGTGNAIISCGDLTVGDMDPDCFLDCANGETCPDGMVCRVGMLQTYCSRPVQPLAMYGDCGNVAAPCISGNCAEFGGNAVCVSSCPLGDGDCDVAPAATVYAEDCWQVFDPPAGNECYIPCVSSTDCLPGMVCIDIGMGFVDFCMWGP